MKIDREAYAQAFENSVRSLIAEDVHFKAAVESGDEEEIERLEEIIEEEGSYILEENEGWSAWETEMWVTGPIEILNEDKECVLIIIADKDGNPVEYKEDQ